MEIYTIHWILKSLKTKKKTLTKIQTEYDNATMLVENSHELLTIERKKNENKEKKNHDTNPKKTTMCEFFISFFFFLVDFFAQNNVILLHFAVCHLYD